MSGKAAIAAAKKRRAGASNTSNYSQQQFTPNAKIEVEQNKGRIHINDAVKFLGRKFSELEERVLPSIINETNTNIGVLTSNLESLKNYVLENDSSDEKLQDLENSITELKLLILENKKQAANNKSELALIKKQLNSLLDANLSSNLDESSVEHAIHELESEENVVESVSDVVESEENVVESVSDVVETESNEVESVSDVVEPVSDVVEPVSDVVETESNEVEAEENVVETESNDVEADGNGNGNGNDNDQIQLQVNESNN